MVNQAEYLDWLQQPITIKFREYLKKMIETTKDDWAGGVFTAESAEGTAQKNAVALGQVQLLEDLINLDEEAL